MTNVERLPTDRALPETIFGNNLQIGDDFADFLMKSMDFERSEQFTLLVAQHTRHLQRYIVTLLAGSSAGAEDILQDVLVALWRKFPEFDAAKPFLPWAFRFAYYEVLNYRRSKKAEPLIFDDAMLERMAAAYSDRYGVLETRRSILDECLGKLPLRDRELITVRYESDQSVDEIARRCGLPPSKLYNGLRRIRNVLMNCVQLKLRQEVGNEA